MKIFSDLSTLEQSLLQHKDQSITLTGGVFDLFHIGHLRFLKKASEYSDLLIVHINTDNLTKKQKGTFRPIISQEFRSEIIASLDFVDFVLVSDLGFDTEQVLNSIQPSVLVKTKRPEVQEEERENRVQYFKRQYPNMQVVFLDPVTVISTSEIIKKIKFPQVLVSTISLEEKDFIQKAKDAADNGYSYSGFKVGVVTVWDQGNIWTGCNISNASPSLGLCAEQVAITNAVLSGNKILQKVIIYSKGDTFTSPCGSCRQRIVEFSSEKRIQYLFLQMIQILL